LNTAEALVLAALIASSTALAAAPADTMSVTQQNTLVQKYCAVCHTDTAKNGGLSLQHFDAADADPSLAAMLLSKVRSGALGASGLPAPDTATRSALVSALTSEAAASHEWTVKQAQDSETKQRIVTAAMVRDLPSDKNAGENSVYRLVLSCNAASHEGGMQLSWSPTPATGTLYASLDAKAPIAIKVEGSETMGNGQGSAAGPAAVTLFETKQGSRRTSGEVKLPLPLQDLTISNLFPGETVVFPFDVLPPPARESLSACFAAGSDR
jgi:hypothetical protein